MKGDESAAGTGNARMIERLAAGRRPHSPISNTARPNEEPGEPPVGAPSGARSSGRPNDGRRPIQSSRPVGTSVDATTLPPTLDAIADHPTHAIGRAPHREERILGELLDHQHIAVG